MNLTQSLAVRVRRCTVNCVSGGLVATDDSLDHYGGEAGLPASADTVPAGPLGTPTDIARRVAFLVSPLSSYTTGANLVLHGGGEWPAFLRAPED